MRRLTVFCAVMLVAISAFCFGESRVDRQTVLANESDGTQGRFVVVEGKFPFLQTVPQMISRYHSWWTRQRVARVSMKVQRPTPKDLHPSAVGKKPITIGSLGIRRKGS